jgi:hypothetical protein
MFFGLLWHGLFALFSSVVVSIGTVNSLSHAALAHGSEAPDRKLMWISVTFIAFVSASYSLYHYSLT